MSAITGTKPTSSLASAVTALVAQPFRAAAADGVTAKEVKFFSEAVQCYAKIYLPKGFGSESKSPAVVLAPAPGATSSSKPVLTLGTMTSPVSSGIIEKGKVSGSNLTATINADVQGQPTTIQLEGKLDGRKMSGTLNVPGFGVLPSTG